MNGKVDGIISSFIPTHIRRQVRELYASTIILNFAIAMVSIFQPVFLFLYFSKFFGLSVSLSLILAFYLIVYVGYFFTLPLGSKFAKKFGYEYCIAIGCIFTALFYFALFAVNISAYYFIPAIILYVLCKAFYWPAYHANFSKFSVDGEQGREVGNLVVLEALVNIAGPLMGGFLIQGLGFKSLFILSAIIMILSNVPMLLTKEKFIPRDFSYGDCYKRLFAKKNIKRQISFWGYGEEFVVLVIWPIFMYLIIGNFAELGSITAIATFATTAIFLYIGKLTDRTNPEKVLKFGTISYFFAWLFRLFSWTTWSVFLVDTFSKIAKQAVSVPMVSQVYHEARQESEMERVVFYEMSLVVGKIIAIILAMLLVLIFNQVWIALFILAGIMSLLYFFF